jgi:predicted amidohydrolase
MLSGLDEQIHVGSWPYLFPVLGEDMHWGMTREVIASSPFQVPGGGGSRIFGPDGRLLAGGDMDPGQEGLVICDVDLRDILKAKTLLDGVGHYSRPDIFS